MLDRRVRKLEAAQPLRGSLRELVESMTHGQKRAAFTAIQARDTGALATVLEDAGWTLEDVMARYQGALP